MSETPRVDPSIPRFLIGTPQKSVFLMDEIQVPINIPQSTNNPMISFLTRSSSTNKKKGPSFDPLPVVW